MEPEGAHAAQGPILISTNIQLTHCYDFISSSNNSMETYTWERKEEEKLFTFYWLPVILDIVSYSEEDGGRSREVTRNLNFHPYNKNILMIQY